MACEGDLTTPDLKVVELYAANFRDPAAGLRIIADEIEAGEYGDVGCVGIALLGNKLHVFGLGRDSEAPAVGMVLHAGFLYMSKAILEHGSDG